MVEAFLDYLRYEKNRSALTVSAYAKDLASFERFFKSIDAQLDWTSVDSDIIRNWLEQMMDGGNNATSVRRRLSAVRSLYRFALSRNYVDKDVAFGVKSPKMGKSLPSFMQEKEMQELLDETPVGDDFISVRNHAIISTFYSTGMRLSELVGLDVSSVDMKAQQIKVLGKRSKERVIPFGKELKEILAHYIYIMYARCKDHTGALFVSTTGKRLHAVTIANVVRGQLAKVTNMKKRSPHVLRHSFATGMINNGASLEAVRKILGHESLSTTEIYTHTTFEQLKKSYSKAHPRESE